MANWAENQSVVGLIVCFRAYGVFLGSLALDNRLDMCFNCRPYYGKEIDVHPQASCYRFWLLCFLLLL